MTIFLKKAKLSDSEFLLNLRNQPDVYKYSRISRPVKHKEHIAWLNLVLLRKEKKDLFIIKQKSVSLGQIRFDYLKNGEVEISISISRESRKRGIGTESLKKAISLMKKNKKVKIILAEVRSDNIPSQKFFEKLNFKLEKKSRNWLKFVLKI